MYKAVILPLAKQDIKNAAAWYESMQKDLGKRFVKDVRRKVLFVCHQPGATAVRYDETRCATLEVFPFMIHFTVDDALKLIIVSAVFHTSLNPDRWAQR
jgi:plasmid stabilization system protein ParE